MSPLRTAGPAAARVAYSGHTKPEVMYARLTAAPRGVTGDAGTAAAHVTRVLLGALIALVGQIDALTEQIREQLATHADGHVFTSLPRAGSVRAARLLAEIGDVRGRYPTPESLICAAEVAPSTRQSGKVTIVSFRWSADKQLRDAVCEFAGDSRLSNPWAQDLYRRARARGHDHPHAVRILARAWLQVIWRCWQDGTTYDPARHRAPQRLTQRDQPGQDEPSVA
jgi:transposase